MRNIRHYKLVYVGGALDHTVLPIVLKLYEIYKNDFAFVASKERPLSRKELGYGVLNNSYNFVLKGYGNSKSIHNATKYIFDADVVIYGSVSNRRLIRKRLFTRKISISITERMFKEPTTFLRIIKRFFGTLIHYYFFPKKNKYALCIGGYAPNDFDIANLYKKSRLKWAYFTDYSKLKFEELEEIKQHNKIIISWIGRFIEVKQPHMMLRLAKYLQDKNIAFEIKMVGYGPLLEECKRIVINFGLQKEVTFTGAVPLQEKENILNQTNIFAFTSTQEEGWGAVVNEALGSACLVIASKESGAPSQLIKDNKDGLLFDCSNQQQFNQLVMFAIDNYDSLSSIRRNGYDLVHSLWNEDIASKRLAKVINDLISKKTISFCNDGPCSEALAIK